MQVLMTGHEGFIGSWLRAELRSRGHQVHGHGMGEGSLLEDGAFVAALAKSRADAVVHLAAQVGREFGERNVHHTVRSNAELTAVVASVCGQRRVPVLYASTSEVYGDQGNALCYEDGPLTPPHNLYGLTKLWGEQVLRLYAPDGLKIARLSMPYGPGAPPGHGRRAMDNFLWRAHHRMPIYVHRGAERSWCWICDTVRALRMILELGSHHTYNVGRADQPISMLDLAKMACWIAGAEYDLIEEIDPPAMQTVVKRLSNQRLRDEFAWTPSVDLEEGMRAVYEWVKEFDANGRRIGRCPHCGGRMEPAGSRRVCSTCGWNVPASA